MCIFERKYTQSDIIKEIMVSWVRLNIIEKEKERVIIEWKAKSVQEMGAE